MTSGRPLGTLWPGTPAMSAYTCETRTRAVELKFVVDSALGATIRDWARGHLEPDPHGRGSFTDQYRTASVYFDTRDFDVFNRRGSFGRAKFRIRRYGSDGVVFLERKLRKPGILVKRRTPIPLELLECLNDVGSETRWPGEWFRRRIRARGLRPICELSYHRTARAAMTAAGPIRLTLDDDLRAIPAHAAHFNSQPGQPILAGQMILELKFRDYLPAIFRRLVEDFALQMPGASKYRIGMAVLGHVPVTPALERPEPLEAGRPSRILELCEPLRC